MGVPKFFKWLAEKCPMIIQPYDAEIFPGIDNLYLDMNGIIHNCTHPDDSNLTYNEDEKNVMLKIFQYIEMLFDMVKPMKYFFMGVDGVAPRAKMNQQRQRRFRAALEREQMYNKKKELGEELPDLSTVFDSNCITPGTEFMQRLDEKLKFFIEKKIESDEGWRKCKIIYSGYSVPGEGEHKIMEFIRNRKIKEKIPNETHCMYGLDADLIMLGLASHEPYFMLLREDVFGRYSSASDKDKPLVPEFELLHLSILRDYLEYEFQEGVTYDNYAFSIDRALDDFILICFFCGNDFLPHIPSLDIRYGAVQELINHYKKVVPKMKGYLTYDGKVNFDHLEQFLSSMKPVEDRILQRKYMDLEKQRGGRGRGRGRGRGGRRGRRGRRGREVVYGKNGMPVEEDGFSIYTPRIPVRTGVTEEFFSSEPKPSSGKPEDEGEEIEDDGELDQLDLEIQEVLMAHRGKKKNVDTKKKKKKDDLFFSFPGDKKEEEEEEETDDKDTRKTSNRVLFGPNNALDEELDKDVERIGGERFSSISVVDYGKWRENYYRKKLGIEIEEKGQDFWDLCRVYTEGIKWNYAYYYQGCCSWKWFYPYHYSPLPSDMENLSKFADETDFGESKPFHPYQQLLGVLPPRSSELLPEVYRFLFHKENSPMKKFYPNDFDIDKEGTKYEWEGTVIIPFIEEDELFRAEQLVRLNLLTPAEIKRNSFAKELVYQYCFEKFPPERVDSPFPGTVPSFLSVAKSKKFRIRLPPHDNYFHPEITKGTLLPGKGGLLSFPSIHFKETSCKTKKIGVKVFRFPSRNATSVITLREPPLFSPNDEQSIKNLLGKRVFLCYPIPREGQVTSIATRFTSYYGKNDSVNHTKTHSEAFLTESSFHEDILLKRFGLNVGQVEVLVYVRLFKSMKKNIRGGEIVRDLSGERQEYAFPLQLVIPWSRAKLLEDKRFSHKKSEKFLCEKSRVVLLSKSNFGCCGEITKLNGQTNQFEIRVKVPPSKPMGLPRRLSYDEKYFDMKKSSRILRENMRTIALITSSVFIKTTGRKKRNVGLNIRSAAQSKRVVGYAQCQYDEQTLDRSYYLNFNSKHSKTRRSQFNTTQKYGWELSQKAIDLIKSFRNEFPEIFDAINNHGDGNNKYRNNHRSNDRFNDITWKDIYPKSRTDGDAELKKVEKWIHSQDYYKLPMLPTDQQVLAPEDCCSLEETYLQKREREKPTVTVLNFGFSGSEYLHDPREPLPIGFNFTKHLRLCSEVVYVQTTGPVPFGSRGLVTGIQGNKVRVLFEDEFMGGTRQRKDVLKTHRSQIVFRERLIDLTRPVIPKIHDSRRGQENEKKYYDFWLRRERNKDVAFKFQNAKKKMEIQQLKLKQQQQEEEEEVDDEDDDSIISAEDLEKQLKNPLNSSTYSSNFDSVAFFQMVLDTEKDKRDKNLLNSELTKLGIDPNSKGPPQQQQQQQHRNQQRYGGRGKGRGGGGGGGGGQNNRRKRSDNNRRSNNNNSNNNYGYREVYNSRRGGVQNRDGYNNNNNQRRSGGGGQRGSGGRGQRSGSGGGGGRGYSHQQRRGQRNNYGGYNRF